MHLMHDDDGHPRPRRTPLFAITGLIHRYPDGREGLKGIDLDIHHGDRIALVGHNGSGKTTLIKHLNGLLAATSGTVHYKGETLAGDRLASLRLEVGVLFQDPDDQLFCSTLFEDVAFGPMNQGLPQKVVEHRTKEALRRVGLEHFTYKPAHHLSYGQKKRAALATLLAMNPEVLILDEPTANLDPRQEKVFHRLLAEFEGTLICITHNLLFLRSICNRAVVLSEGRVHHDYGFEDLIAHPASLREHGLDFTFRLSCCGDHHHPAAAPAEANGSSLFRLRNYLFHYPDNTVALKEINLAVREGEKIALVGENGAGKSTLAGVLLGLHEGHGDYFYQGQPVTSRLKKKLWQRVGIVFQNAADQLFCPSCREEVAFGPVQLGLAAAEVERRVTAALHRVQLDGCEERVPLNMSGGERKRLAVAAVLALEPEVLILDEPTAGLDPQGEEMLLAILEQLPMTTILITHDIFFITRLSRRTIVLHQGRIIRDYATADFLADQHLQSANDLDFTFRNDCSHG
ncbi:MAG: ABC transporter ATP-binding protein [Thermodesulfobacteriota bacterium]